MTTESLFDTHAHVLSADTARYPPSDEGRHGAAPPYTVEQLLADMDTCGVPHACAVQRFHHYFTDNRYVLDAARSSAARLTPVVMLDGRDETAAAELRTLAKQQRLGALRLATLRHTDYDTAWLDGPAALRLWEEAAKLALPVCVIGYVRHLPSNLPAIGRLAERFPELPIVVDHLGLPHAPVAFLPIVSEGRPLPPPGPPGYGFSPPLLALREHRNVHFKLTGLNLEYLAHANVDAAALMRRFVAEFGAERVMCGTDIGQTRGPYARIVRELRAALALLTDAERAAVLSGTASHVFGSSPEAT